MPKNRTIKIDKYINPERKKASIIGDMLLAELLTKHSILYKDVKLITNKNGKPYIANKNLFFSISHSHEYVIAAISNRKIGIDIEKIRKTPLNTINYFANEKEKKQIIKSKDQLKSIYKLYTLKEAYIKMIGLNINSFFDVEFLINNDKIVCSDNNIEAKFITNVDNYIISYCQKKH